MTPVLHLTPYRLALRRPWQSARGRCAERRGWLVTAQGGGLQGYGDCAPLPEAGTESGGQAEARLRHWADRARKLDRRNALSHLLDALAALDPSCPSADCAVETALLDLAARQRGLPLRRLLVAESGDAVAVNAMLGAVASVTPAQLVERCAQGYAVVKLKVGTGAPADELARLRRLSDRLPSQCRLRLDANGAWTLEQAEAVIDALADLPMDCLEEPLREPDDGALAALQRRAGFSLALDESLAGRDRPIDPAALPVRRLVLKPGAVGGLRRTLDLARLARSAGHEVVLTSLIESAAGLWATAQLAAATGSTLAHGLDTAAWLARDLGLPPRPERGRIRLPGTAGSGFSPADPMP